MNRIRMLALPAVLAAVVLMAGCYLPAAPDVTATPAGDGGAQAGTGTAISGPTVVFPDSVLPTATTIVVEPVTAAATEPASTAATPSPTLEPTAEPTSSSQVTPTVSPTTGPATGFSPTPTPTPTPTATPTASPTAVVTGTDTIYVVKPGDNLYRIALRHGMKFAELAAYNNIVNPSRIYVGQEIRIPAGGTTPSPTPGETIYTVQPGDNLYRIAMRYQMNYLTLAHYNGITNPHRIFVGQQLRIPASR